MVEVKDDKDKKGAPVVTPTPGQAGPPGTPAPAPGTPAGTPSPGDKDKMVPLAALHESRQAIVDLKEQMKLIKEAAGETLTYDAAGKPIRVPIPVPNVADTPVPGRMTQDKLTELWDSDPRSAMQTELNMAFQWYDKVNQQIGGQERVMEKKYDDYDKYRSEVHNYLQTLPPEQRAKSGVVNLAYFAVKGQNVDGIVDAKVAEAIKKIKAGEEVQGFTTGTTSAPSQVDKPAVATEDQKKVAAAMNMSVEEYMKNIKVPKA